MLLEARIRSLYQRPSHTNLFTHLAVKTHDSHHLIVFSTFNSMNGGSNDDKKPSKVPPFNENDIENASAETLRVILAFAMKENKALKEEKASLKEEIASLKEQLKVKKGDSLEMLYSVFRGADTLSDVPDDEFEFYS